LIRENEETDPKCYYHSGGCSPAKPSPHAPMLGIVCRSHEQKTYDNPSPSENKDGCSPCFCPMRQGLSHHCIHTTHLSRKLLVIILNSSCYQTIRTRRRNTVRAGSASLPALTLLLRVTSQDRL